MSKVSLASQEQLALISKPALVVSKISVPNTQIANRAQIIDPANDLNISFGLKRISCQTLYLINSERGPAIDGVFLGREIATASITTSNSRSLDEKFYLSPGQHTIYITWKAGDTLTAIDVGRALTVTEL